MKTMRVAAVVLATLVFGASIAQAGPVRGDHSRGGGKSSNTPILDALRDNGRKGDYPVLNALKDRYNDRGGYNGNYYGDYDRHHHDSEAKAYRDAAIANAVVGLVGIAVEASRPRPVYVAEPVRVVEPRGYYRTERVLVDPGHYEEYREWVPEGRDHCGRLTGGYYLNHRRWVPDVFEERRVWVQY